jgi:hypothetical protein
MTPQQIYNYLIRNDVPQILAAGIAHDMQESSTRHLPSLYKLSLWVLNMRWHNPISEWLYTDLRQTDFWLNPLLLPKQFRPKKVRK